MAQKDQEIKQDTKDTKKDESPKIEGKSKKWSTKKYSKKELADILVQANTDLDRMRNYKKQACIYDLNNSDIDSRYKRDDEIFLMLSEINDEGWSDQHSPALLKNVNAILADFSANDVLDRLKAYALEDIPKAKILEKVLETVNKKNEIGSVDDRTFQELARHGKAFEMVSWKKIESMYEEIKKKDLTDDEKKDMEKGVLPTRWVKKIEFEDQDVDNILPQSVLVDPGAYRIHGRRKPASMVALDEWISEEDFEKEKAVSQYGKDLEQVTTNGAGAGNDFWDRPKDNGKEGQVRRVTIFYKGEKPKIVTLYDGVIGSIKPLPFGVIPIFDYSFMDLDDEFWTPGLGALLDPLIREQDRTQNNLINRLIMEVNPPTFVDSRAAGEIAATGTRMAVGEMTPLTGLADSPNMVQPMRLGTGGMSEAFQLMSTLSQNVDEISGINARRHGSLQRSYNASEVQIVDNSTAKIISMLIRNYFKGRSHRVKQQLRWIEQEYTKDIVRDRYGKKLEKPKKKTILLEGVEFEYDDQNIDKYKKREIEGASSLEINKGMFDFYEEYQVYPDPEVIAKLTKEFEFKKWQQLFPQLVPLSGDPRYLQPGQPVPPFNIYKLAREFAKAADAEDILNAVEFDEEDDMELALLQNQKIMEGEIVSGQPGRTLEHINVHEQLMMVMEQMIKEKKKMIPPPQVDPQYEQMAQMAQMQGMQPPPPPIPMKTPEELAVEEMQNRLEYIKWHISVDRQTVGEAPKAYNQFGGSMQQVPQITGGSPPMPQGVSGAGIVPPPAARPV